MKPRSFALPLALLSLMLLGCAGRVERAATALNATQPFLVTASSVLTELHRRERDAAVEASASEPEARAAVARVHERFRGVWDAYDGARVAWMSAEAAVRSAQAAEAAGLDPDTGRVDAAVVAFVAAYRAFEVAARALPPFARAPQRAAGAQPEAP